MKLSRQSQSARRLSGRILKKCVLVTACCILSTGSGFSQQVAGRYRISGTVVSSTTGQPVAQARVIVSPTQAREDERVVITGPDGRFQFDDLPAGKYALGGGKPGFVMQGFKQHENYSSAIAVGPGVSADNLLFSINPAAAISGQIVDEQGEPVRDAQLILFRSSLQEGKQTIRAADRTSSDDRGLYRFASLSPGTYYLVLSARPWYAAESPLITQPNDSGQVQSNALLDVTYPILYYSGASDPAQATPIKLAAGDHVTADFALTPVRALHIHVRAPKLNASQGYGVILTPEAFQGINLRVPVSVQTMTSKQGEIEISGVAPGQYRLQMVFPGKNTVTYAESLDLQNDTDIDASVPGQGRTISGTLRMQGGAALPPGLFVYLRNTVSGEGARAPVGPMGQFQFGVHEVLPPGTYGVAVPGESFYMLALSATGARVVGRTLELRGSDSVTLHIVVAQGRARVDGTAVSADNDSPIAGAMVVLVPDDLANNSILLRRDQSDSDGTFTLPTIVPGHYTLIAIRNGWNLEWMNPAVLKPYLAGGQSIQVERDGQYKLKVRVQ